MNINETRDAIGEKVREVEAFADSLPERAKSLKSRAEFTVQEKPLLCLVGAFAVGFLIAKVARRA